MNPFLEFILNLLSQFAGGTGHLENNLVRFSIPSVTYGVLLSVAWARQREKNLPREKLLVWGFGLGSASAMLMAFFVSLQMLHIIERENAYPFLVPLERALEVASIIVVAGAFLRYILDDARLAQGYIAWGAGITFLCLVIALWQWPYHYNSLTEAKFHTHWVAWLFEVVSSSFIIAAIVFLRKSRGWLPNVVTVALVFFLIGEVLLLVNYATDKLYSHTICPIGNSFPMFAIPLLAYVYLREQAMETRRAQKDLETYRDHLEELVSERTAEIEAVNSQLKDEVRVRKQAEAEIAQRNASLAAQNTIAAALSRSIELDTMLDTVLAAVLSVVHIDAGMVFLWNLDGELNLRSYRGFIFEGGSWPEQDWDCCAAISTEAMSSMRAIVRAVTDCPSASESLMMNREGFATLVSIPLASNVLAVGALTLASRRTNPVLPHELELLIILGQQIGMAIENAHLFQKAERAAQQLTLLHEISNILTSTLKAERINEIIVEQSARLLNCQVSYILTWDEGEQRGKLVSYYGINEIELELLQHQLDKNASTQNVLISTESIIIDDAQFDHRLSKVGGDVFGAQAFICVPIRSMNELHGCLFVIDRHTPRRWKHEELVFIESLVNRAAAALMNAHLIKQKEWAAALEERQLIAADMHDGLAQTVSLLGLQIEGAMELIMSDSNQQAVEDLVIARETVDHVSLEVRRSIASLQKTPQVRRSLQDMLSGLLIQIASGPKCRVNFMCRVEEPLFLPRDQGDQVLFLVQEALLNANRHANAREIAITLERLEGEVLIKVEDDGQGFEPGAWWQSKEHHFGLGIMHSRALRIGARLQIDTSPGQGTRVILSLPLPEQIGNVIIGVV